MKIAAQRQNKTVNLTWTTTNEVNVKSYTVERSEDGVSWQTILNNIPALGLAGNNNYQQTDNTYNPKQLFYRIRQFDVDGRYTYSSTWLLQLKQLKTV